MTHRILRLPTLCAAAIGLGLGGFTTIEAPTTEAGSTALSLSFGAPAAEAHVRPWAHPHPHGPARRAARRAYRHSVAGCVYYAPYYRCGAVYYAPVVENGETVYVEIDIDVDVDAD